jgi:hypothetical protein
VALKGALENELFSHAGWWWLIELRRELAEFRTFLWAPASISLIWNPTYNRDLSPLAINTKAKHNRGKHT